MGLIFVGSCKEYFIPGGSLALCEGCNINAPRELFCSAYWVITTLTDLDDIFNNAFKLETYEAELEGTDYCSGIEGI